MSAPRSLEAERVLDRHHQRANIERGQTIQVRVRELNMNTYNLFIYIPFSLALFAISAFATWIMTHWKIMDLPTHRSSHDQPVAKGGGVAIVVSFFLGYAALYGFGGAARIPEPYMAGFALAALAIAAVSLVDDIRKFSFAVKLASQILATAVILASGLVLETLSFPYFGTLTLGWFGYPLTALWIIGLTNAFNFMDGLNGLAGGTAVIVALFFGIVTFLDGNAFVAALCFIILFSTLGFLIFNFPQARVFMSDVGSQFLGFVFAVLAVIASQYESAHTSFLVMPLLFFHFIYDTTLTFLRRLIHREKIAAAHRSHLYQLANRLGLSHVQVSLYHYLIAILQGLGALWLIHLPPDRRALAFAPFFLFQCGYALVILVRADRRGLLHLRR